MPNWCNNYANITCPTKELYNKLIDAINNDKWFETFAPLQINDPTNESGWDYLIAVNTWGTKWSATNIEINNTDDVNLIIELYFDTAWSPPIGVYKIMNTVFDISTTAYYSVDGCSFFG